MQVPEKELGAPPPPPQLGVSTASVMLTVKQILNTFCSVPFLYFFFQKSYNPHLDVFDLAKTETNVVFLVKAK